MAGGAEWISGRGRLPITFPASIAQTPNPVLPGAALVAKVGGDKGLYDLPESQKHFAVTYPEGADVGYRWYDRTKAKPRFAFGYGLSYTRFAYKDLALTGGPTLRASFAVTNVGARPGVEVAQVYARVRGVRRLVGWSRLALRPGETRRVTVAADPRLLADFDVKGRSWRLAAGTYAVEVSASVDRPQLTGQARLDARRLKP